jgi:hypothetical protein
MGWKPGPTRCHARSSAGAATCSAAVVTMSTALRWTSFCHDTGDMITTSSAVSSSIVLTAENAGDAAAKSIG